ncbi:DUF3800 domain-containing protein [Patescibacteria group bacterium]|nr:DUF3800 domain-containing protein [Patescibacteria group bacterium]
MSEESDNKYSFFLDETGDHGLSFVDKNFPLFLLVGCLFEQKELARVENKINDFKMDFFKTTEVILHSRDIRKCEGAFQILFDLKTKERFYNELNDIIANANFSIIGAGVNKEEHIKKYGKGAKDPYVISLGFIIERLIFCLDAKSFSATVDIKIEKRGRKEDGQLLDQYNSILDRGTYYVESHRLKNKIDSFESFLKRNNIIGLQVADLCAYPVARHILNPKEPYIPFQIIEKKLYCSKDGKYDGYGLKIFP